MDREFTVNKKKFIKMLEGISAINDEAVFYADTNGVNIIQIDPSQICMATVKDAETRVPEPIQFGLNFTRALKLFKNSKSVADLLLKLYDEQPNAHLDIMENGNTFTVPLIEMDRRTKELNIEPDAVIEVLAGQLKDKLKVADNIASWVKIVAEKDKNLIIRAKGDVAQAELGIIPYLQNHLLGNEKATVNVSLEYFMKMIETADSDTIVRLNIKTDQPLKVEYEIKGIKFAYFIAPRREEEC